MKRIQILTVCVPGLLAWMFVLMISEPAWPQSFRTDSGHVSFSSSVPLHSFTGTSEHLTGQINLVDSTVDFYVDLNSIRTGIGKRDRDMRSTLDTEKYPFAEFFGHLASPFDPGSDEVQQAVVEGNFSIHGVSQKVRIEGELQKEGENLSLEAAWTIRLEDYDIEPPGILFYRVDQEQEIYIEATLIPIQE